MRLLRPSALYARPLLSFFVGLLIFMLPLFGLMAIFSTPTKDTNLNDHSLSIESTLGNQIAGLGERIRHAEMLNRERKKEILHLRSQIDSLDRIRLHSARNGSLNCNLTNYNPLQMPMAGGQGDNVLQVPSLIDFMPHLLNFQDPLKPAFTIRSRTTRSNQATIVFGVPTVKRPVESYLMSTLSNLIANLNDEEKEEAIIVVFIAEVSLIVAI